MSMLVLLLLLIAVPLGVFVALVYLAKWIWRRG
jgi:ABC-type phosphate transport system permease subunit